MAGISLLTADRTAPAPAGLVVLGIGLAVTSGAIWVVPAAGSDHHGVEVVVLTVANLAVTVMRFVAMRTWMFVRRRR